MIGLLAMYSPFCSRHSLAIATQRPKATSYKRDGDSCLPFRARRSKHAEKAVFHMLPPLALIFERQKSSVSERVRRRSMSD